MSSQSSNTYQAAFFVIPSYILDLPGMTLGYLKIYETIFQFWNHNQHCFLSESSLCERTGLGRAYIYRALNYFENINELQRKHLNGKRYLIRPPKAIETDCTLSVPTSTTVDVDVHYSRRRPSTTVDHNIKNINKETKCVGEPSAHTVVSFSSKAESQAQKAHDDEGAKQLFKTKFAGTSASYEQVFNDCKEHYDYKNQWVTSKKWKSWLEREKLENYSKSSSTTKKAPTGESDQERGNRHFFTNEMEKELRDPSYISEWLRKMPEMREKYAKYVR